MRATVRNGRLVVNDQTDLPEGTEVEIEVIEDDGLDDEERRKLHEALARSEDDLANGRVFSGAQVLDEIKRLR